MKCPMLTMYATSFKPPEEYEDRDCLKEECAWWDKPVERCLWLNVSEKLSFIYLELNEIRGKMTEGGSP